MWVGSPAKIEKTRKSDFVGVVGEKVTGVWTPG